MVRFWHFVNNTIWFFHVHPTWNDSHQQQLKLKNIKRFSDSEAATGAVWFKKKKRPNNNGRMKISIGFSLRCLNCWQHIDITFILLVLFIHFIACFLFSATRKTFQRFSLRENKTYKNKQYAEWFRSQNEICYMLFRLDLFKIIARFWSIFFIKFNAMLVACPTSGCAALKRLKFSECWQW